MFVNLMFMMYRILITILLSSTLMSNIKVGDDAPTFFVRDLAEKNFFFSDTLKLGRPTVLSFFATWCGPCIKEIRELEILQDKYADEPVAFFLIDLTDYYRNKGVKAYKSAPKTEDLLAKKGLEKIIFLSSGITVSKIYKA